MIYRVKITLPESKIFLREYAISGDMTLFAFHNFICSALAFDPDQMVYFSTFDADGKKTAAYGLFDMGKGSMDTVTLAKVVKDGAATVRYFFDMRRKRYFIVEITGEITDPRTEAGSLLESKGDDPQQFAEKYIDPEVVVPRKPSYSDEDGKLLVDEDYGKEA